MMMIPKRKDYNIIDSFFGDPFFDDKKRDSYNNIMKTDIKEKDNNYVLEIDLPGYKKEDISIELNKGYLIVSAKSNKEVNEEDKKEKYIYKERFVGECSRSFYVGDTITEEDIRATFKNGMLEIIVPKEEPKKVEEKKHIEIEG